jgi:hypothetical protein
VITAAVVIVGDVSATVSFLMTGGTLCTAPSITGSIGFNPSVSKIVGRLIRITAAAAPLYSYFYSFAQNDELLKIDFNEPLRFLTFFPFNVCNSVEIRTNYYTSIRSKNYWLSN